MPRKLMKRFAPDHAKLKATPGLKFLGKILDDPNLFHLNRHSVSLAFMVGLFCTFVPLPGQMILAAFLAYLVGCNMPLSVALVWISNPITIPPIFYATYKLGTYLLDTPPIDFSIELSWAWMASEFPKIWEPLVVGSLISGVFFGVLGYLAMQWFWRWHVISNWEKRQRERAERKKSK
ncbi:MAG: DUF2062 domain-containing protein [Cellvibrionaceae bacterium]